MTSSIAKNIWYTSDDPILWAHHEKVYLCPECSWAGTDTELSKDLIFDDYEYPESQLVEEVERFCPKCDFHFNPDESYLIGNRSPALAAEVQRSC